MRNFNTFMAGSLGTRKNWFSTFPVDEILLNGARKDDPESVLLIDIAGGEGHDIEAFHKSFADVSGKLILQDLPPAIDNIKSLDPAVVRQKYDFFYRTAHQGSARLLPPHHIPQLARQRVHRHHEKHRGCHGAELQQAPDLRVDSAG